MIDISASNAYARHFAAAGGGASGVSWKGSQAGASAKAAPQMAGAGEAAAAPRTLDECKRDFRQFIDAIPIHPAASATNITVNISEAAFERMLNEPEFEEKIKGLLVRDLCDPSFARSQPATMDIQVDASGGEYLARSAGDPRTDTSPSRSAGSFWHRDHDDAAAAGKKAKQKREDGQAFLERLAARRLQEKRENSEYFLRISALAGYAGATTAGGSAGMERLV